MLRVQRSSANIWYADLTIKAIPWDLESDTVATDHTIDVSGDLLQSHFSTVCNMG
jgi:hypothetical protein